MRVGIVACVVACALWVIAVCRRRSCTSLAATTTRCRQMPLARPFDVMVEGDGVFGPEFLCHIRSQRVGMTASAEDHRRGHHRPRHTLCIRATPGQTDISGADYGYRWSVVATTTTDDPATVTPDPGSDDARPR